MKFEGFAIFYLHDEDSGKRLMDFGWRLACTEESKEA